MNFDQFKKLLSNLGESGEFSFGYNWLDYVKSKLSENIIGAHLNNLQALYRKVGIDVRGLRVLDIGCGSGLSSLCFSRMGCAAITSVDVDPYSVEATLLTKRQFAVGDGVWQVVQGSILDANLLEGQSFDLVYSWGVLHHTGDMWTAIEHAASLVSPCGGLHLALYRSGRGLQDHLLQKSLFRFLDRDGKIKMLFDYLAAGKDDVPEGVFLVDARGMNVFHDALDWLGGLPYEVCHPLASKAFLKAFGLYEVFRQEAGQGGNYEQIFRREIC